MPRFRFRLDPLLRARRFAEQQRQREVADIETERRALEDRLRRCQQAISAGKEGLRDELIGRIRPEDLRLQAHLSLTQMRQAQRLALELAGMHQRLEKARDGLIEATRERRAIELLRDRRLAEWRREQERAETAALDELAVMRAARQENLL